MKVHIRLWSTFWPPNILESDYYKPLSLDSDDIMFVIATQSAMAKISF